MITDDQARGDMDAARELGAAEREFLGGEVAEADDEGESESHYTEGDDWQPPAAPEGPLDFAGNPDYVDHAFKVKAA